MAYKKHKRRIGELENELLKALKHISELEVNNAHLEKVAHEDPLTQIYNRRGFEKRLKSIQSIAERRPEDFKHLRPVFISVDIDHFKLVNDSYGHGGGDEVLKQFATLLLQSIRPYDILGRFGGEEFVIAMIDISIKEACTKSELILDKVRGNEFKVNNRQNIKLTASFGIGNTIENSDAAVYRAKENGRDQVVA